MTDRPLDHILNQLKIYDELEICDLLGITSEDLINKFFDRIVRKRKYLERELEIFETGDDNDPEIPEGFQELNFNDD